MRPPRRRRTEVDSEPVEVPEWVRRFNAPDWPPPAEPEEERTRPARHRWLDARSRWARKHRVDLAALVRAGEVESTYAHLRGGPR